MLKRQALIVPDLWAERWSRATRAVTACIDSDKFLNIMKSLIRNFISYKIGWMVVLLLCGGIGTFGVKQIFFARPIFPVILVLQTNPVTPEEIAFLKKVNPYGILLLKNSLERGLPPNELKKQLQQALKRKNLYFFIDQEGGSVNRLQRLFPHKTYPAAKTWKEMAQQDAAAAYRAVYEYGYSVGKDLAQAGFDVNFAPVADACEGANFLGDRCFSSDPKIVSLLAGAFAQGLNKAHIIPVYKHAPGIASAHLDPHTQLAVIDRSLVQLKEVEVNAMQGCEKWPYLQTGHAIYTAIDPDNSSTYSAKFYQFIRRELSFNGLIIPDALNMTSANIPGKTRGEQMELALEAGADIVMPFFSFSMSFDEQYKELQKIQPRHIKQFNKKIKKMSQK